MTCPPEIQFSGFHLLGLLFTAFAFFMLGRIRARKQLNEDSIQRSVADVVRRDRKLDQGAGTAPVSPAISGVSGWQGRPRSSVLWRNGGGGAHLALKRRT